MKNLASPSQKGFTLVETLVAITVLLVAITGPMTLATDSLVATRIARERLSATFLAQEAIEYIRYERGNNFLQGSNWMSGIGGVCNGNGCLINIPTGVISSCGGGCTPLTYNTTTYQYGYETGTDWAVSPYTRTVVVNNLGESAVVTATVSWDDSGTTRSVTATTVLHRWYGSSEL